MKVIAINGSPKGEKSNCHLMLTAFTKELDCEVVTINLAEKKIENCKGCYSCWTSNRGCNVKDDFNDIIFSASGADLIIFASPVYSGNVSGLFKNFIDRLISTENPHAEVKIGAPKFVMMSNCGFSSEREFEVISLWINQFVDRIKSKLLGEYYFTSGKRLKDKDDVDAVSYLQKLSEEGKRIVDSL